MTVPEHSDPLERLVEIMRILRSDHGCPWDREQTLESLKPNLIEESYEVLDAIDSGDSEKLKEELGDLLLQVVFQSQLCAEKDWFNFKDVAARIADKLVVRHPHVFGDTSVSGTDEVLENWEKIKRDENNNGPRSITEGIPRHLPALHKAEQVQKRVARVGFDWSKSSDAFNKLDEEIDELKEAVSTGNKDSVQSELGDVLFTVVNIARLNGYHAEQALNDTVNRFSSRFRLVEDRVHAQGKSLSECTLEELDSHWNDVKAEEGYVQRGGREV